MDRGHSTDGRSCLEPAVALSCSCGGSSVLDLTTKDTEDVVCIVRV